MAEQERATSTHTNHENDNGQNLAGSAGRLRHQGGFSLLETIIALVILALAFATLFEAYGNGIRAISAGNRHAEARLLAQSLLATVSEPAKPETRTGTSGDLSWRLVVKPASGDLASTEEAAPNPLYEVLATVAWTPGRRISLRSLRLGGKVTGAPK